jgi:hypothetical protein
VGNASLSNLSARRNPDGSRPACRHCAKRPVTRPRGLCWTCWTSKGVRDLYPSDSKFARRGTPNFCGPGKEPDPTDFLPGTPDKVAVLEARADRGEDLWHPGDAPLSPVVYQNRPPPGRRPGHNAERDVA